MLLTGYVTVTKDKQPGAIVGFTVSKKRVRLAVHRNRIKRLMREAVRKNFWEIRNRAEEQEHRIEVVLSYKGRNEIDVRRLPLHTIEADWTTIKKKIMKLA